MPRPEGFKFPDGFRFADQGTEREEVAADLLYDLLFDPAMLQMQDEAAMRAEEEDRADAERLEAWGVDRDDGSDDA